MMIAEPDFDFEALFCFVFKELDYLNVDSKILCVIYSTVKREMIVMRITGYKRRYDLHDMQSSIRKVINMNYGSKIIRTQHELI